MLSVESTEFSMLIDFDLDSATHALDLAEWIESFDQYAWMVMHPF